MEAVLYTQCNLEKSHPGCRAAPLSFLRQTWSRAEGFTVSSPDRPPTCLQEKGFITTVLYTSSTYDVFVNKRMQSCMQMNWLVVITGYQPGCGCCPNNLSSPSSFKEQGLPWLSYLQVTERALQHVTGRGSRREAELQLTHKSFSGTERSSEWMNVRSAAAAQKGSNTQNLEMLRDTRVANWLYSRKRRNWKLNVDTG